MNFVLSCYFYSSSLSRMKFHMQKIVIQNLYPSFGLQFQWTTHPHIKVCVTSASKLVWFTKKRININGNSETRNFVKENFLRYTVWSLSISLSRSLAQTSPLPTYLSLNSSEHM
ncbi:hypothetical protein T07_1088 [Trichinella nelsoni]|uniref:Uncharacterized protein n=1 Tax=Trichinella nelsoni TaxID=6336 RepID=A0A0V0RDJ2_9BILA|nr:hypothetical protein T07_1088 [Trichinella nelsoni]